MVVGLYVSLKPEYSLLLPLLLPIPLLMPHLIPLLIPLPLSLLLPLIVNDNTTLRITRSRDPYGRDDGLLRACDLALNNMFALKTSRTNRIGLIVSYKNLEFFELLLYLITICRG